jgi:hypothetical protein
MGALHQLWWSLDSQMKVDITVPLRSWREITVKATSVSQKKFERSVHDVCLPVNPRG